MTAVQSGDEAAAKALWTAESAQYYEIEDTLRSRETAFTLIRSEQHDTYVRLQVLEEWGGMQMAHFYYLIRQDDRYFFQYPFLMFAGDWPTVKTTHFTFHVRPSADELFTAQNDSVTLLDTLPYERYVSRLLQLTALDLQQPIDYYLCDDSSQVSLLSGIRNAPRYTFGSWSITTRANDFSEIAKIVLLRQRSPIEFLRVGLCGFGEYERVLLKATPRSTLSIYSKCSEYLSRLTPDTLDMLFDLETAEPSLQQHLYTMRFHVAASLVSEMLQRDSVYQFATLYKGSWTVDDFQRLFVDLYGEQPLTVLGKLNQQYTDYIDKIGPTLQNSQNAGSH